MAGVLLSALWSCGARGRFTRSPQADFLEVPGSYTAVIPSAAFMASAFGPDWASQSLYYSHPIFNKNCEPQMGQRGTSKPLAKGRPVFMFGCTGWSDSTAVYSLEKAQFVTVRINLQQHTIAADAPVKPQIHLEPTVLDDGTLLLRHR